MNSRIEVSADGQWVFGVIDGRSVIAADVRTGAGTSHQRYATLEEAEAYAALIQAVVAKVRELREEGGAV